MKVSRNDAVALCTALGFKTASKWDKSRMQRKLIELATMAEEGGIQVDEGDDNADQLNDLLTNLVNANGDIEVVKELAQAEPEVVVEKPAKATKPAKAPKKPATSAKPKAKAQPEPEDEDEEDEEEEVEEKQEVKEKDKKTKTPRGRARLRACGQVLRELGMKDGSFKLEITPKLIKRVDTLVGKENEAQTEAGLVQAWSALAGYFEDGI